MAETAVEIRGLRDLHELLQRFPARIERNVVQGALRAGANVVAKRAKEIAGISKRTGELQKSIRVSASKQKGSSQGRVSVRVVAGNEKAFYAHLIEYGTGSFYQGTGTKSKRAPFSIKPKRGRGKKALAFGDDSVYSSVVHPGIRPRPFMRSALDSTQEQYLRAIIKYTVKRIEKEFKKVSAKT